MYCKFSSTGKFCSHPDAQISYCVNEDDQSDYKCPLKDKKPCPYFKDWLCQNLQRFNLVCTPDDCDLAELHGMSELDEGSYKGE